MSDSDLKSNIHCFICNSRAGVSIRNAVQIFSDQNKLPSSEKLLREAISEIVKKSISKDIHSHIICKKCYRLFQEYDELQFRMDEIKNEVLQQFKKTLTSYDMDYETFRSVKSDDIKVEKDSTKQEGHEAQKDTHFTKTEKQLPVAIDNNKPNMLSVKNIRSLPPNVVILSRQGKKIAIQKTIKTPPAIIKSNQNVENSTDPIALSLLQPKSQTDNSEPTEINPEPAILPIEPDNVQIPIGQEKQDVELQQNHHDEELEQSREESNYQQIETLDYVEDSNEDLDQVAEDEESDNFVISHMEILDGHDSSSIELEEGTFLMEQAEDGSIIRVLHHPNNLYSKEDDNSEMDAMQAEQQSEGETRYEEIQEGPTTINLDSVSTLGKNSFIRLNKDTLPILSDKTSVKGAFFVDGESLSFDQMVQSVGDNTYQCMLCEKMKKNKSKDKEVDEGSGESADQDGKVYKQEETQQCEENELLDNAESQKDKINFFGEAKVMTYHMRVLHNVRLHICEVCGEIFRRRAEITQHMDEHANIMKELGVYTCTNCDKSFDSVRLYRSHLKADHPQQMKQHECHICSRKFGSRKLLEEHNNTHIGVRPYNCDICGKTFASKYTYQSHLKTHMDRPRPYTCAQCGKSFFTMQNLTQHEKTHLGIKDFVCNICGKAFGTQHNLEVHGVVHTGYKPFVCRTCNKAFARRAEIRDHERTHTGERPYICDLCGSTFSQRSNLQSHKRATHFDDKRYKCRNCDKRFKRRRLLEYHIKASHTGERPYKCSTCDATFVYPEHFKKHLRIHSGEKPYKCEVCDKAFNSRDNRNAHRFIHSDKKPYECLDCGAGFMRKPLLYAHMQSQGHLSDTIVVNQPRLNGELESGGKINALGNTFILEDGQEVIINNIKEEVFAEAQLVSDVALSGSASQRSEDLVFGGDMEEELSEDHPNTKLLVRTHVKHGHIVIGGSEDTSKAVDADADETGMDVGDTETEGYQLDGEGDGDDTIITTTDVDLANSNRIQIINGEGDEHQSLIEGTDGTMRFFQIRMPNGEKGWVALNSCEETP